MDRREAEKKTQELSEEPGLFWHVHHELLLEWCYNPRERALYVSETKVQDELKTRLERMRPIFNPPQWLRDLIGNTSGETSSGQREIHARLQGLTGDQKMHLLKMHEAQCPNCPFFRYLNYNWPRGNLF